MALMDNARPGALLNLAGWWRHDLGPKADQRKQDGLFKFTQHMVRIGKRERKATEDPLARQEV
ncbi:MAG: hypothetical protein IPL75_15640 [Acidobacteria bacterium]|nr:hypothetical protein [Acidobacteriota bacterium]